ncbi:MAG: hypothetical protein PHN42_04595 [Bacilli bacterium]|nr:hypothetical protein [Bacilli bacterium]
MKPEQKKMINDYNKFKKQINKIIWKNEIELIEIKKNKSELEEKIDLAYLNIKSVIKDNKRNKKEIVINMILYLISSLLLIYSNVNNIFIILNFTCMGFFIYIKIKEKEDNKNLIIKYQDVINSANKIKQYCDNKEKSLEKMQSKLRSERDFINKQISLIEGLFENKMNIDDDIIKNDNSKTKILNIKRR